MRAAIRLALAALLLTGTGFAGVNCTVSTAGVAFGNYGPLANSNSDITGTVSVTCTGSIGDTVSFTLSASAGSGTLTNRHMTSGANQLLYELYTDSARTHTWGDGTNGTQQISEPQFQLTSTSVTKIYTVYGRIPNAQTTARTGSYSDTLVVTVKW
jgi:spore coat protein U-like protein